MRAKNRLDVSMIGNGTTKLPPMFKGTFVRSVHCTGGKRLSVWASTKPVVVFVHESVTCVELPEIDKIGGTAPTKHGENSDVLFVGSVAVAVMKYPGGSEPLNVATKFVSQLAAVVTNLSPR